MSATLYVVPTPVGNLEDMTFRAINVLKEADLILAEDTRTTGKLTSHFGIETPKQSFHMHNEHKVVERYISQILEGTTIALVSDAGTPGSAILGFCSYAQPQRQVLKSLHCRAQQLLFRRL